MILQRSITLLKRGLLKVLRRKNKKMNRSQKCENFQSQGHTMFDVGHRGLDCTGHMSDSSGYSSADESDSDVSTMCAGRGQACPSPSDCSLSSGVHRLTLTSSSVSSSCQSLSSASPSANVSSLSAARQSCSGTSTESTPSTSSQQSQTSLDVPCVKSALIGSRASKAPQRLTDDNAARCFSISVWSQLSRSLQNRLDASDIAGWLYATEDALFAADWQQEALLTPSAMALVHILIRKLINSAKADTSRGWSSRLKSACNLTTDAPTLKSAILACLYVVCSYSGQEITYPCWPYLASATETFWQQTISIGLRFSSELLHMHRNMAMYDAECELLIVHAKTNIRKCCSRLPKQTVPDSVAELLLQEMAASTKSSGVNV